MRDAIENTFRNMRPYDIDSSHYGPILISVVMKKFPEEFGLELSRLMLVGKWDLTKLLEVFSKEFISRERYLSTKSSETSQIIGSWGLNSGSILLNVFYSIKIWLYSGSILSYPILFSTLFYCCF